MSLVAMVIPSFSQIISKYFFWPPSEPPAGFPWFWFCCRFNKTSRSSFTNQMWEWACLSALWALIGQKQEVLQRQTCDWMRSWLDLEGPGCSTGSEPPSIWAGAFWENRPSYRNWYQVRSSWTLDGGSDGSERFWDSERYFLSFWEPKRFWYWSQHLLTFRRN